MSGFSKTFDTAPIGKLVCKLDGEDGDYVKNVVHKELEKGETIMGYAKKENY